MKTYICKYCEKEFETPHKLGGHIIRCKENPNYEKNKINCNNFNKSTKKRKKDNTIYYCQYCGKECKGNNSLHNHEKRCSKNPNKIISGIEIFNNSEHTVWNKGLNKFNNDSILSHSLKITGIVGPNKGKHLSEEQKSKIRKSTIKYLESLTNKEFKCRYNKNACKFIDELNKQNNWHLQHAENGGEIEVDGYFLDGYDKKLNIAFEYDESAHYKDIINNILNDKDILRQNYIINKLHCEFWRYNEKINLLYKI